MVPLSPALGDALLIGRFALLEFLTTLLGLQTLMNNISAKFAVHYIIQSINLEPQHQG